jgi:hypothetical protein
MVLAKMPREQLRSQKVNWGKERGEWNIESDFANNEG